jgi:hypothetical protein
MQSDAVGVVASHLISCAACCLLALCQIGVSGQPVLAGVAERTSIASIEEFDLEETMLDISAVILRDVLKISVPSKIRR